MSRRPAVRGDGEPLPESDRFGEARHPRATDVLFGHAAAEAEMLSAWRSGRLPPAWLIGGKEGIGKATLAWRFARFLLANSDAGATDQATLTLPADHSVVRRVSAMAHPDVAVLRRTFDPKAKKLRTEIRVDDVRDVIGMFHHASGAGGWRIAIVDSAEDLNGSSANALLKLIEEPPPRALFLILAHRPGQVLTTIRSRSRKLMLGELSVADVGRAVGALGEPWSDLGEPRIADAAARSGGSVRDALRLLSGDSLSLIEAVDGLLSRLPLVDWRRVHMLADRLTGREATEEFEAAIAALFDWIDVRVKDGARSGAHLAPLAEVWDKIAFSARETLALNLDRRTFILNAFTDLATAVQAAQGRLRNP